MSVNINNDNYDNEVFFKCLENLLPTIISLKGFRTLKISFF